MKYDHDEMLIDVVHKCKLRKSRRLKGWKNTNGYGSNELA